MSMRYNLNCLDYPKKRASGGMASKALLLPITSCICFPLSNIKIQAKKNSTKCFLLFSCPGSFCVFLEVIYKEKSILKAF